MTEARVEHEATGEPARRFRSCHDCTHSSWSRERRVVGKAEHLVRGTNPRFVIISLSAEHVDARRLYEDRYCARGDREKRMKEPQLGLFADRTSSPMMQANQLRLYCSSFTHTLTPAFRQMALAGTQWSRTVHHDSFALVEDGNAVTITTRRIWLAFSKSCPRTEAFEDILACLHRAPPWQLAG